MTATKVLPAATMAATNGAEPAFDLIKTVEMDVTPDMARDWLYEAGGNRALRRGLVDQYARDMEAGRWALTHQGIAFDTHGRLSDGQHRLEAVAQSGCTVRMKVSHGVDIVTPIDRGLSRTINDRLTLQFGFSLKHQIAVLNKLTTRGQRTSSGYRLSDSELMALYERHQRAVDFAATVLKTGNRRGFSDALTGTVLARAFYHDPIARISDFYRAVVTGMCESACDNAAARLSSVLMRETLTPAARYGKTEAALRAFCDYRPITAVVTAGSELYPLPEEAHIKPPRRRRADGTEADDAS